MASGMQIFIGADHRGFKTKQQLAQFLTQFYHDAKVSDVGAYEYDPEDDFNDPAIAVASNVTDNIETSYGILICGSSFGVCMQANRFPEIRAINPLNLEMAELGRKHNAANVLCLSADQLSFAEMCSIVCIFLQTAPLPDEKYQRRSQRLDEVN